jgi:cellobiose-specific phosphotransferase system component IIA
VVNGKTYYYELEDFEASGRRERHGPVWARPDVGLTSEAAPGGGESSSGSSSSITVGETGSTLREVGRGRGYVELELVTHGFTALPLADGSTALSVAGFSEEWEAGEPAVPVKRVWIEALAGKEVRIGSVRTRDVTSFSLRPAAADAPAVIVESSGTVRAGRKPRQSRRNRLLRVETDGNTGVYPPESARVLSVGFDGEEKKALLELAPMQWNPSTGQLVLAQSLVVRVEFDGVVWGERSLGGSRGRRYRGGTRPEPSGSQVLARLATTKSGLYGVSYASIFGSRGQGLPTSSLRLSRQGESVAYRVEPATSVFGPGSVLYFVSEGAELNPYGLEAVVELEVGVSGDVMGEDTTVPSGGPLSHYVHREEVEENHFYATSFTTPLWLWETLLSGMRGSYALEVSELSMTPVSGDVEVWLKGVSRVEEFYPPRVRLSLNGVVLAEEEWGSEELTRLSAELPPGVLVEGPNSLLLENVSTSDYTAVMLDRFSVSYPRRVVAEGGVLRGKWSESGRAEVSGVEGDSLVVDVTGPAPLWLTQTTPVVDGVAFHARSAREYLVVSPGSVLRPEVRRSSTSRLKDTNQQADYLVLAPKAFLGATLPLLRLRHDQGLRSRAVSLEEVYREFGHGESSPEAIREFLSYAYHEWQSPSVRYVVLLGDGSYDFKDYLGTGVVNRVPPRLEPTSFMWTASDSWYGRVNGEDVLADVSIGRLPASTVEEAHRMVAKIVSYETSGQSLEGSVVLVTDDPDQGGDFEEDAEELAGGILVSRAPRKIYLGELGVSSTKSAIVQAFDEGTALMSYIGHGSITFWAQENVFDKESISGLRPQQEQPLVLTMNCLNGFFHYPYLDALAEELILAEDKGAIAVVSPSGLSLNGPAHRFHRALLEELTSGEHVTLGDAMLAAQSRYADRGEFLELLTIFHVFGDPALKLQR